MIVGRHVEDGSLNGTPYILHPEAVLDCSHYFLNRIASGKGDFAKGVYKPGDAASQEETEMDKEGEDFSAHGLFPARGVMVVFREVFRLGDLILSD